MEEEKRKHWLLSRKFWLAVFAAAVIVLEQYTGIHIDPENLTALVIPIVVYIVGESAIDITAILKAAKEVAKDIETKK